MARLSRARQVQIAERLHAVQDRLLNRLSQALRVFFREQAARVVERYHAAQPKQPTTVTVHAHALAYVPLIRSLGSPSLTGNANWSPTGTAVLEQKVAAEELMPEDENRRLSMIIVPILQQAWVEAGGLAGDLVGAKPLSETDPRLQDLLRRAGTMIRGINETTLAAVRAALVEAGVQGYSPYQIANGVAEDGFDGIRAVVTETYSGRAETIARTELATTSQEAVHSQYEDMQVSEVDIIDGPECGWEEHDDPDLADGSRRSLIDAQQHPLSHPNCRRVSIPVLE